MHAFQANPEPNPCFVRITGTQRQRFIEFEFSVGDPELSVEMIMPVQAFEEFCARHDARQLSAEQVAQVEYERLKWRFGEPGITE
ncbi:hypothetical protein PS862_01588 [Pseudomonas fluorescens]|uniref:Phenol hydroxylase n=1 Tax=Pseudomonas fluorescens TaxID=294 RepID=A0A5E7IH18_PSEFL|nr:phenol hydroxylase subunit [Pseudomonas fluorescens]VVO76169.1 hypothetical protein PS862_01588 [Pseudomonas fluorescens]